MNWDNTKIILIVFLCIVVLILIIIFIYWFYKKISYSYEKFVGDVKSNLYNLHDLEAGKYGELVWQYWLKFKKSDYERWKLSRKVTRRKKKSTSIKKI